MTDAFTTTDEALTEQTEAALWGLIRVYDARSGRGTEVFVHAPVHAVVAAALPIIRKAQADAWQAGVNFALPRAETTHFARHNPHRTEEDA